MTASKHKAIGKSKAAPSFLKSPGARFIVTRVLGREKPEFDKLDNILSKDSFTAVSGKPTKTQRGSPFLHHLPQL
jgi:hypothetical protein